MNLRLRTTSHSFPHCVVKRKRTMFDISTICLINFVILSDDPETSKGMTAIKYEENLAHLDPKVRNFREDLNRAKNLTKSSTIPNPF